MAIGTVAPNAGLHLWEAIPEEAEVYFKQECRHPAFRRPVKVGDVIIDQYNGPGIWFGGAGF